MVSAPTSLNTYDLACTPPPPYENFLATGLVDKEEGLMKEKGDRVDER